MNRSGTEAPPDGAFLLTLPGQLRQRKGRGRRCDVVLLTVVDTRGRPAGAGPLSEMTISWGTSGDLHSG